MDGKQRRVVGVWPGTHAVSDSDGHHIGDLRDVGDKPGRAWLLVSPSGERIGDAYARSIEDALAIILDGVKFTEITVGPSDAVAVNLPPLTTLRVTREGQPARDYAPWVVDGQAMPVIAVLWGTVFGGAAICTYGGLAGIRNGHHQRDRGIWHEAARLIARGGVAYVGHEQRDWYGKQVWWATTVRTDR